VINNKAVVPCASSGVFMLTVTERTKYRHEEIITAIIRRRDFLDIGKFCKLNMHSIQND